MLPQPSMDLPSPFADPTLLLNHGSSAAATEATQPALQISIRGPFSGSISALALQIKASVQPLQLLYQPSCFARLAAILAGPGGESRTAELLEVISELESPEVRALCTAELALRGAFSPAISFEVRHLFHTSMTWFFEACGWRDYQ